MRWWHLPAVRELEVELFAPDDWSPEVFWSELAGHPATRYVVALADEQVVGYAGVALLGGDAHVQTMAVARAEQGRGLGRVLLRELLAHAEEVGAARVLLEVRADNPVAQALYVAAGFVPLGVRRRYYQPSGADAAVMALADPAAGVAALSRHPHPST